MSFKAANSDSQDDETTEMLFDKLRSVFLTHARRQYGIFDPNPDFVLSGLLGDYARQSLDAGALADAIANQFHSLLPTVEFEMQHFLWVVIDQSGDSYVAYLFLLNNDESYHITSSIRVSQGHSLFVNRLLYGARVHITEWLEGQSRTYLSLLCPKNQQPQTMAWSSLIGYAEGIDRAAKTEEFLDTIETFASTLPQEKAQETRERVIDYCMDQSRSGKPVDLQALSEHVDETAPEALLDFVKERGEAPFLELYTDRNKLKRYTRFYGRDHDLSIGFSTAMLGQQIAYDENSDTLIIKSIPKALKSQLQIFLKKN